MAGPQRDRTSKSEHPIAEAAIGHEPMRRPVAHVLLEAPDGPEGTRLWRELTERGYEVSWCPGPEGPPPAWCPLMSGHPCDLVEESDVVVSALGLRRTECREVLAHIGIVHPRAKVIVEASGSEMTRHATLLSRHVALRSPVAAGELAEAIEAVMSARPTPAAAT